MRRVLALVANCTLFAIVASGQVVTTFATFDYNSGTAPVSPLIQAADGNFYGSAAQSGANSQGTVFKMTTAGVITALYSFCRQSLCADGALPWAGLVQASDGNFYGTTYYGGYPYGNCTRGCGTIFRITPSGSLTTLFQFHGWDGKAPSASLVQASDGNLYGTTEWGGTKSWGTLFKISLHGDFSVIYNFCSLGQEKCLDGANPRTALVQGADGSLYGTTPSFGPHGFGSIFKITPQGSLTTLYGFSGSDSDGVAPAGLMLASDGNFYGSAGLGLSNLGMIFRMTPQGTLTTLHIFTQQYWTAPITTLVQGRDGNLYGPGSIGPYGSGTLLEITLAGDPTILHSFNGQNGTGDNPGQLMQAADGNFYGLASPNIAFRLLGQSYHLAVNRNGQGSVTSGDGKINCGSTCSHDYLSGTPVTLTATPSAGWVFGSWSGCDNVNNNVCAVDMNNNRTATATFIPTYRLTVAKIGNGTVTSSDGHINCGSTCSYTYRGGTVVTLTASPDQTWAFTNWSGCDQVNGNVCTVTVNSARSVTATFTATYQLTVSDTGSGTIRSKDGYINCGSICTHTYLSGSVVNLTAAPGSGWGFSGWSGCDQGRANGCLEVMNANRTVTAIFKILYPLSISKNGNGGVSSTDGYINCGNTCSYSYIDGSVITLSAIPSPGYTFSGWIGCNDVNGSYCSVTLTGAKNVTANFASSGITLASLTVKPSYVKGGQLAAGTLVLNGPAPSGGLSVALSSDHPGVAHPPAVVFVPGGQSSISFAVQTFPVSSNITVTVTATAGNSHVSGTLVVGPTFNPPSLK